jgi:hypothetical protein
VLKKDRGAQGDLLRESGLRGALQAVRDLIRGYRKLTDDVKEHLETRVLFDDRPSELPQDLERRGEFWFRSGQEGAGPYAWDPDRLRDDLTSEDSGTREAARAAAIGHGNAALLPMLLPLLESERREVRSAALDIMGSWKDPGVLPFVTARLREDPDPGTRVRAVLALKELDDERVVEPLLAAAGDGEKIVRVWAGAALKEWLPRLTRDELKRRVEVALSALYGRPQAGGTGDGKAGRPPAAGQEDFDL